MATEINKIAPNEREAAVDTAVATTVVIGSILNFPVGSYEFRLIDENTAFSTRIIDIRENTEQMTLFLVKGEVKEIAGKKQILDKGHRDLSVDLPDLWKSMKTGITYRFSVEEYKAKKKNDDGSISEVLRKRCTNWVEQGV